MNPGLLKKRISILKQTSVQNSYGESENAWNEVAVVWANVNPLQGRELFQANQIHSEVSIKVTIRYRPGILPKMRLKFGEHLLQIIFVINIDERNRFLELSCKEVI
jgi:SPP1 family predicted phage head-tail adaptor